MSRRVKPTKNCLSLGTRGENGLLAAPSHTSLKDIDDREPPVS